MSSYLAIFDWLSVLALVFMGFGVLKQWRHIYKTRSVKDIVTQEVFIRFIITWILSVKIILIGDIYLIVGQIIFGVTMTIYFFTLLIIKRKSRAA